MIPNFTIGQTLNATQIVFTDTSTLVDVAVTDRRIFLQKVDGTNLVPSGITTPYVDFPLSAGASQTTNVLTADAVLNIVINWVDVNGVTLYTKSQIFNFKQFAVSQTYFFLQAQAANPSLANHKNFWENLVRLYVDIFNSDQALIQGGDQFSSQLALDDAAYLIANPTLFF